MLSRIVRRAVTTSTHLHRGVLNVRVLSTSHQQQQQPPFSDYEFAAKHLAPQVVARPPILWTHGQGTTLTSTLDTPTRSLTRTLSICLTRQLSLQRQGRALPRLCVRHRRHQHGPQPSRHCSRRAEAGVAGMPHPDERRLPSTDDRSRQALAAGVASWPRITVVCRCAATLVLA